MTRHYIGSLLLLCACTKPGPEVLVSRDGGGRWSNCGPSSAQDYVFRSVWASSGDDIYVVGASSGNHGAVLHGQRGGKRWSEVRLNAATFHAVWGSGPDDVYVAGDLGHLFRLGAGGQEVHPLRSGTDRSLHAVWGSGATDIYMVGDEGVFHSEDRGQHWHKQATGPAVSVWGSSAADVYVAGEQGLFHTMDGGKSWQPRQFPSPHVHALWGRSRTEIYAGDDHGVVFRTTDGGQTWHTACRTPTDDNILALGGTAARVLALTIDGDLYEVGGPGEAGCSLRWPHGDYDRTRLWSAPSGELFLIGSKKSTASHYNIR